MKNVKLLLVAAAVVRAVSGYGYLDLNRNGTMEPYEDPSLPRERRIDDLISGAASLCGRLSISVPHDVSQVPAFYNHPITGRPDHDCLRITDFSVCGYWNREGTRCCDPGEYRIWIAPNSRDLGKGVSYIMK